MSLSSLQCYFSSLRFVGKYICTSLLRSLNTISVALRSRLWLDHCNNLLLFQPFCFAAEFWDNCLVTWHSFSRTLAVRQMASHLTLEIFGILGSSWSTLWLQVSRSCVCKTSPYHHFSTTTVEIPLYKPNLCHVLFREKRLSPAAPRHFSIKLSPTSELNP